MSRISDSPANWNSNQIPCIFTVVRIHDFQQSVFYIIWNLQKMRIPLLYIPKTRIRKVLYIEKRYRYERAIVPLGSDCHPAYTLQKLNLRESSFPFDWLNTESIRGLLFVRQNIENRFKYFIHNMRKNDFGNLVSEKYPYSEFIHEKNIDGNAADIDRFKRRITRFLRLLERDVSFLYNVTGSSFTTEKAVDFFYGSVVDFLSVMKKNDKLHMYIRYDEDCRENEIQCNRLIEKIGNLDQVVIVRYLRSKSQYGTWGNENKYLALYDELGIKLKQTFPRMFIK